jgi:group I intron endonuclease
MKTSKICGIYKITSPSDKIYIGQSIDIEKRRYMYSKYHCSNQVKLHNSITKYGFDQHSFDIIEECDISELNNKERFYQEYYDVLGKMGLNLKYTETNDLS